MNRSFLLCSLSLLIAANAFAQLAQGPANGSVTSGVTVNTNNFESNDAPDGGPLARPVRNKVDVPPLPAPANMPPPTGPAGSNFFEDPATSDAPPPITVGSFNGIPQTNSIPPDPHIAVGPNHIIQVVNTSWRITDKNGVTLKTITADAWFTSAFGSNPGAFDPKVHFDHFANRWIMVWLHQSDANQTAAYLVSVSDDADPIGTWYNWSLPSNVYGSTSNGSWADYQGVGFDQQAFYFTSNQFGFNSSGYQGARIRILGKAQFYANSAGAITWTDFWGLRDLSGNDVFGTRPSVVYTSPNEYYLVGKPNFTTGTYFALYRITNPLTAPVISCVHVPATAWSNASNANQLGGGTPLIDGGGSAIRNEPIYRDSSLWVVHNVANGSFSVVRYVRINTATNTTIEDVAFGSANSWHFYPALIVDKDKNVGITFSRSSTAEYAGAFYTWRLSTDPAGLRPTELIRPGAGNYVVTFGTARNRWGDYLGAALDPADRNNVWFLSEHAAATNTWGVWVHGVRFVPYTGARVASTVASRDFGRIEVPRSSDTLEIKVNNVGSATLSISGITKSSAAYNFLNLPTFPLTLSTFDSIKFKIYFRPTSAGSVNDTIRIASNDGGNPTVKIPINGRGVVIGKAQAGVLYGATSGSTTSRLYSINKTTGVGTAIGSIGVPEIFSLAIRPSNLEICGSVSSGTQTSFYRLSSASGDALPLTTINLGNLRAFTFGLGDTVYAGSTTGGLYRINISTGDTAFIGTAPSIVYSGFSFNPLTRKLWGSVRPPLTGRDRIYTVNTTTGAATLVGATGDNRITPAIAFDALGVLYGLKGTTTEIDTLISIDTTTGAGFRIGPTGVVGLQALAMRTDSVGSLVVRELPTGVPQEFVLNQNYPNPFNPTTQITYGIPEQSRVRLTIFNSLGQEIVRLVDQSQSGGSYSATWDARTSSGVQIASGIYFYKLEATSTNGRTFLQTKKLVLLR